MPQLTVNGKVCSFEGKKSVLQVALDNGVEIPHYCYHPGMSVVASCRICLAEIAQPNPRRDNQLELIPKLVPTCQTPAVDGMEVHTDSPKAVANQKAVMEYLLINHPLDCPVCDQAGECSLQDYSYQYGRSASRFEEQKIKQPKKDIGPHVLLYSDRCIMCSRCVRFTREVTGTSELGVFGRGHKEQIDIFPGRALNNELSGNVVDICPVGALLDKDFLMTMRVWNLKKTPSIDGLTSGGDNISVETNEGKVYRIKPRTNMDVNQWWISDELRYGWKFVHDENRLRSPMHKVHGALEECDWKTAYTQVTEGIANTSLAVLISPTLPCEEAYLLGKLAIKLDANAVIGIGPVPVSGEDKTFPGGFTILAEKAPNARGVRRALAQLTENVLDFQAFCRQAASAKSLLLTGNYPSNWPPAELVKLCEGRFTVVIDTLPNKLTDAADILLPGATWLEKAGTFENVSNRLQSFEQAISVIELAKSEGQIAQDLLTAPTFRGSPYNADKLRRELGDVFVTDVRHPPAAPNRTCDMQYVPL
ncbi:MAG: molybdopterin-dependent oxidoreductase [Phycisphaeraceae bacterium]|nr:molybdopterin-dependent oxidoreductase [Phycisphaeraceae bacterium]